MLEVRPDGTVLRDDPYLPPRAETDLPRPRGHASARRRARAAAGPTVRGALRRALEAGEITAEQRREWRGAYNSALRTRADLSGARRVQLSSVIETLEAIARAEQLDASRMPALFLQLERNTEYWPNRPYPASGQRITFAGSSLIFQYYPGQGLQIQPLANFGKANGLWRAGRAERLRALLDELVAIASHRGRFTTWEYWFRFGGGTPPWMSAMAQGTAIQALSRASVLLGDPSYLRVARRGIRAFSTRAPLGTRVRGPRRRQPLPDLFVLARAARAERLRAEPERPLRLRDDLAARARPAPVREGRRLAARRAAGLRHRRLDALLARRAWRPRSSTTSSRPTSSATCARSSARARTATRPRGSRATRSSRRGSRSGPRGSSRATSSTCGSTSRSARPCG